MRIELVSLWQQPIERVSVEQLPNAGHVTITAGDGSLHLEWLDGQLVSAVLYVGSGVLASRPPVFLGHATPNESVAVPHGLAPERP